MTTCLQDSGGQYAVQTPSGSSTIIAGGECPQRHAGRATGHAMGAPHCVSQRSAGSALLSLCLFGSKMLGARQGQCRGRGGMVGTLGAVLGGDLWTWPQGGELARLATADTQNPFLSSVILAGVVLNTISFLPFFHTHFSSFCTIEVGRCVLCLHHGRPPPASLHIRTKRTAVELTVPKF